MANTDGNISAVGDRPQEKEPHILIVEDDDVLLRGMRDLLELEGYRVSYAVDGAEGVRVLRQMRVAHDHPDLIISDIRMPNMDGYEFLSQVRAEPDWLAIPFIFLTAKGSKADIRFGKLRGVDDYITKPFDFPDLVISVRQALLRHEGLNQLQELRMESLKQRILTVLHHEFRTPLSYIVAYSDLLSSSPLFEKHEELQQYVRGIQEGSERLSSLIESFLILAELESGYGAKIFERRVSLIEQPAVIVQEANAELTRKAVSLGVTVELSIANPLPPILGDRVYLATSIRHLLDNAIKFSHWNKDAKVHASLTAASGELILTVRDEGIGIPKSEVERLFDTFYQINREKNEQQGAGAGLAIARHVASLHGGSIEVESEEGKGSTFRLRLPAAMISDSD